MEKEKASCGHRVRDREARCYVCVMRDRGLRPGVRPRESRHPMHAYAG